MSDNVQIAPEKGFFLFFIKKIKLGVNIHGLYLEGCRWNIDEG